MIILISSTLDQPMSLFDERDMGAGDWRGYEDEETDHPPSGGPESKWG